MQPILPFPNRIVSIWKPSSSTASRPNFAEAGDGLDYAIKHDEGGVPIRANEWLCTQLAQFIHIPVPPCSLLEGASGKIFFGSQIVHHSANNNASFFTRPTATAAHVTQISRIVAFDLFVGNVDRHINNYLVRDQEGRERVFAFDFSHCLFTYWPDLDLPLPATCNTVRNGRIIRRNWGFNLAAAEDVVMELSKIPYSFVEYSLRSLPDDFLPAPIAASFLQWWKSGNKTRRLRMIKMGLRDGTLL